MSCFSIKTPKNYSCGDNDPLDKRDSLKINNYNNFFEKESDRIIEKNRNYINDKRYCFSNNICNRYLATECQGVYKDVDLENKMVNLNFKSTRGYCPQINHNNKTEYVNGIDFKYKNHPNNLLLDPSNYINCRNIPINQMCPESLCCEKKDADKLWNNLSKNKSGYKHHPCISSFLS